jgi:hypothetical protein
MFVYAYTNVYMCVYMRIQMCICACICVYKRVYMRVYAYTNVYVCVYMRIRTCICARGSRTPFEGAERLSGPAGSRVTLRVAREGGGPAAEVSLERRISVKNPVDAYVVTANDGRQVSPARPGPAR